MSPGARPQTLQLAIQHHQAGQLSLAEEIYRSILALEPDNANVLHLLGTLSHAKGNRAEAMELMRRAIDLAPGVAAYHVNLGGALAADGHTQEAIIATRKALALSPTNAQAHLNLGRLLAGSERLDEAIDHYRRAISYASNMPAALDSLGTALRMLGHADQAEACFRRSLQLRPSHSNTLKNLSQTLHDLGRLDEAAARFLEAALLDPGDAEIQTGYGMVMAGSGRYDEAISAFERALAISPRDTTAMTHLGISLREIGRIDNAIKCFERTLAAGADSRAAACLNVAVHLHPAHGPPDILNQLRKWEDRFARRLGPLNHYFPNHRDPDRHLRVAYLSPQFNDSTVGHQIVQLLAHHHRDNFEILCYSDTRRRDRMTDRIRAAAALWRDVVGFSDERLASLIRQDHVDILVDLTGHMEGNRMLVFARKPAPLQFTLLTYPGTTGLRTMDYRASDSYIDPPAIGSQQDRTETFYTEHTVRLSNCFSFYQPLDDFPLGNALPALRNGHVTFGCLNGFDKIAHSTLALWAVTLRAVPDSRMLILAPKGSARDRTLQAFVHEQIDPARIGFLDRRPRRERLGLFHQFDIGLDTVPCAGFTSSLDSLWMGVPVISLAGETAVSRRGLSILSNIGLPDLCALSAEAFVGSAARLAGDLGRLGELRSTLRGQMRESPLCDASSFTRDVEDAYRTAWRKWCASAPLISPSADRTQLSLTQGKVPFRIVVLEPPGHIWSGGFRELARLLEVSLQSLGHKASIETNAFSQDAVNIVLGYYLMKEPVDAYWVPFQLEQLNVEGRRTAPFMEILSRAPQIWDYDPGNIAFLQTHAIQTARHVPIGFHPAMRTIPNCAPDIDVLHYGFMSERRARILRALAGRCRLQVTVDTWGSARDELISRAKIVLNVHSFESPVFEQVRVSHLLNNGRCIVTEDSPYNPYRDMIAPTPYDQIVDRCMNLLANDTERDRLAAEAARRFSTMPMTQILSRVLDHALHS